MLVLEDDKKKLEDSIQSKRVFGSHAQSILLFYQILLSNKHAFFTLFSDLHNKLSVLEDGIIHTGESITHVQLISFKFSSRVSSISLQNPIEKYMILMHLSVYRIGHL